MLTEDKRAAKIEVTISTATILKIIGIFLLFGLVYFVRDIIAIFFVALVLSSVIDPLADWFEARRIPRAIATLIVYVVLFSILGLVVGILIPPLVQEVRDLASNFSAVWDRVVSGALLFREYSQQNGLSRNIEQGLSTLQTTLTKAIGGVFNTVTSIFGGVVSFMLILVITFYMVLQEDGLKKVFKVLVPPHYQPFANSILGKVQRKIVAWVKGQLILSFIVGLLAYIGLSIIGINYALVLGIFAGLAELVPYAGPFIGGVVAIFFALSQSTAKAVFVAALYIIIQQFENNILVPKVMQKAVGLNPIISILALITGVKIAGVVGALFAIPTVTVLDVIIKEILRTEQDGTGGKQPH